MKCHYSLFLFILSQSCVHNTFIYCCCRIVQSASRLIFGFCNYPFFDFRQEREYFSIFQSFQTGSGPTQPHVQCYRRPFQTGSGPTQPHVQCYRRPFQIGSGPTQPHVSAIGGPFPGLKRPGCETQHLLPSYSELKNSWNCTSIFPYAFLEFTGIALPFVVAACVIAVILTLALS